MTTQDLKKQLMEAVTDIITQYFTPDHERAYYKAKEELSREFDSALSQMEEAARKEGKREMMTYILKEETLMINKSLESLKEKKI